MKAKASSYAISYLLQRIIIIIFLISYILGILMIAYWVIDQYPDNHNLSGYLLISLQTILIPVFMFIPAYVSANKKLVKQARIFDALLFTVIGFTISGIISQIAIFPFVNFYRFGGNSYWGSVINQLILTLLGLVLYYGVLFYSRKHKS